MSEGLAVRTRLQHGVRVLNACAVGGNIPRVKHSIQTKRQAVFSLGVVVHVRAEGSAWTSLVCEHVCVTCAACRFGLSYSFVVSVCVCACTRARAL